MTGALAAATADVAVHVALLAGALALLAALLLGALTLLLRLRAARAERRARRVSDEWTPALVRVAAGRDSQPPALRRSDVPAAMLLFSQYAEALTGEAHRRLADLGREAGFETCALELLARSKSERMLGIMALGHIRASDHWPTLAELLWKRDLAVWLTAARALARLDPVTAVPVVARRLVARNDWHPAHLTRVLRLLPADAVAAKLAQELSVSPPDRIPALLRLIEASGSPACLPDLRRLAAVSSDSEALAGILRVMARFADPADAETARRCITHPHDGVRVQASTALGRFALHRDSALLIDRLSDAAWWVRQRAAQALVGAGRVSRADLERLSDLLPDPYARDALTAALAAAAHDASIGAEGHQVA